MTLIPSIKKGGTTLSHFHFQAGLDILLIALLMVKSKKEVELQTLICGGLE